MKAYIVTVYNSLNSGSFLQATSLYRAVEEAGYEAVFLDAGARNLWKQAFIEFTYMARKARFGSAFGKLRQARKLTRELKGYRTEAYRPELAHADDAVFVLGSDEIWNLSRKSMSDYPVFWGEGLPIARTFSYAPSVNNAKPADFEGREQVRHALAGLAALSVRDMHSKQVLSGFTDREILTVCDPTILMEQKYFADRTEEVPFSGYVLVYAYTIALDRAAVTAIKRFAREKGKKTVAFGSNLKWCDINVNGDAWDFISYIRHADYVCTGTFHGALFSTLFCKDYAVICEGNSKVLEFMSSVGIDRYASGEGIAAMLATPLDRDAVNSRLEQLRKEGRSYLEEALKAAAGNHAEE